MKKLTTAFFLLLLTLGSHSFAENIESKTQDKDLTFSAYLAVADIDNEGLSLKLNDGSEWDIKYFGGLWKLIGWGWFEQSCISHWEIGDTVEIQYPDSGNLTDFILVISNTSKNEYALAYHIQAPSTDYPASLWVVDFDKSTSRVTLSNGTIWFKEKSDMYGAFFYKTPSLEGNWEIGDTLTLMRGEPYMYSNKVLLWNHLTNEMPFVNRLE